MDNKVKNLIIVHQLKKVANNFLSIFLSIYLFKITNNNFNVVLIYNLINYIFLGGLFLLIPKFMYKKNIVSYLRVGIIFTLVLLLTLILMKESAATYFYIIGAIRGISGAFYWLPYHILEFTYNSKKERKHFLAFQNEIGHLIGIVLPIVTGFILNVSTYNLMFIIISIVVIISYFITYKLPVELNERKVNYKHFKNNLLENHNKKMFDIYAAKMFNGLTNSAGVLTEIILILTFLVFKNELNLGALKSVWAILGIMSAFVVSKYIHKKNYSTTIKVLGFLLFLSTMILSYNFSITLFIVYNVIMSISGPILEILEETVSLNAVEDTHVEKYKIEHICFLELFLNIGRVIGFIFVLIAINIFGYEINVLNILMAILTVNILFRIIYITNSIKEKVEEAPVLEN